MRVVSLAATVLPKTGDVHSRAQHTSSAAHTHSVVVCNAALQDRTIFPLSLVVTRLSGQGQESVFMGVLRCA
jgi:hypothetical protein